MYGSLWGPPVHGSIDILDWETLSEGFFYDHLVRIGATFRDFKLIVGHINWSYCSPLFLISGLLTCSVAWHCIYLEMYVTTV